MPPLSTPRPAPRWRRQPDARPRQILEAAFRVFGAQGLHRATLDDVARAAGITKGTIYLYFPGKAALFSAMLKSRVNALLPDIETPVAPGGPAALHAQVEALGARLYRFFRSPAYLGLWRTIVSEAAEFPEVATAVFREGILPANRRIAALIQRGIETGVFRPMDPLIAGRGFAAMFQLFAITQKLMGGERVHPLSDRAVVETVTSIFLRGVSAEGEPSAERRAPRAGIATRRTKGRAKPRAAMAARRTRAGGDGGRAATKAGRTARKTRAAERE
jgi:AcrR family transcriptional regulator